MAMSVHPHRLMFQAPEQGQVALVLTGPDGAPWTLTMSAGSERFIGRYPRLDSIVGTDGPLLAFQAAFPGA